MITVRPDKVTAREPMLRTVSSLILGDIEVSHEAVFAFPTPLFGFPEHHEYALLPATRTGLWWLQSLHNAATAFLLADPFLIDSEYSVDLGESEKQALQIDDVNDVLGLIMITLPPSGGDGATGNFRAPLVLNVTRCIGMQVVGRDESHDLRKPVSLAIFPPQTDGIALQTA